MSILTSASSNSVSRGYDYFNSDKVNNVKQLNDHEYEGYVDGSLKNPYYVKIDIIHPRKSYCDCPFANGNKTCKHMVALYFSIFDDEAEDYKEWLENNYYEDDEYSYNYYDDEDEYDDFYNNQKFDVPLFFDEVLSNYIDELSFEELKKILKKELENDKKRTFELYLEPKYNQYLKKNNNSFVFLEKLNKKINDLIKFYDYNYNDFNKDILNDREKQRIKELYQESSFQKQIDKILFIPELTAYTDFRWLVDLFKKNKTDFEINKFSERLEDYLGSLKHYGIKNNLPKSNVLITIYLLNNFSTRETANSLLKNAKYLEYVDFIIENSVDYMDLYQEFVNIIKRNYFKNKMYIPDILYRFSYIDDYENNEITITHYLYSFLCLGQIEYLDILSHYLDKNKIVLEIETMTKDVFLLMKLYKYFNMYDKLWDLLVNSSYKYLLIDNVEVLKEKYSKDLYNYFIEQFYEILKEDKKREIYKKASKYIKAISKLNDGEQLVNQILCDLRESDYQKCYTLFDEINIALEE